MEYIYFKNYKFYYDAKCSNYFINDNNLTFFKSEYEIRIHISLYNNKLLFRPRYGITIQRINHNTYILIANWFMGEFYEKYG